MAWPWQQRGKKEKQKLKVLELFSKRENRIYGFKTSVTKCSYMKK